MATANTFNESNRDVELKELNDLVKNLLAEQQALKTKLNEQEQTIQTFKNTTITPSANQHKKVSDRAKPNPAKSS
jgi:methionine aminopeptidase